MPDEALTALLSRARGILERYMFEPGGGPIRDDIAEVCMAIDDALPDERVLRLKQTDRERSAA